jgi:hypothetical protein
MCWETGLFHPVRTTTAPLQDKGLETTAKIINWEGDLQSCPEGRIMRVISRKSVFTTPCTGVAYGCSQREEGNADCLLCLDNVPIIQGF